MLENKVLISNKARNKEYTKQFWNPHLYQQELP